MVGGMVIPDHVRADLAGRVLETVLGEKDVAVRLTPSGATEEVPVPPSLIHAPCLGEAHLRSLRDLASACDRVFGAEGHDIEFAFVAESLYLMQRRPITHG